MRITAWFWPIFLSMLYDETKYAPFITLLNDPHPHYSNKINEIVWRWCQIRKVLIYLSFAQSKNVISLFLMIKKKKFTRTEKCDPNFNGITFLSTQFHFIWKLTFLYTPTKIAATKKQSQPLSNLTARCACIFQFRAIFCFCSQNNKKINVIWFLLTQNLRTLARYRQS